MRAARALVAAVVIGPVAGLGLAVGGTETAWAGNPGPVQFSLPSYGLTNPGPIQCPAGTFVVANPGPTQSPSFVLVDPGPVQCPQGVDVFVNPGPINMPQGEAVALPLTAADCQAGTDLLTAELALVAGAPSGGGPGVPGAAAAGAAPTAGAVCPSGDAALAALHAALAGVATAPAGRRTFVLRGPGPINFAAVNPGPSQAPPLSFLYGLTRVGRERIVAFLEGDPDTPILVGSPNGTPGVAILRVPCRAGCA